MTPVVRPMRLEDISRIVRFDREILGQSLGEETLENELRQNLFCHFFVMEDAQTQEFLGHVGLWIDAPLASVLNLYVIPEHQHQGLGRILMDFVIALLQEKGINTLTLEVRMNNEIAKTMYHRFGFEEVAVRKNYYADGEDAYLMLKNIE